MGGGYAWVTLATNDSYSLGALVLAHSLKQVGTQQQLVVLITPGVTSSMRKKLSEIFNIVKEVNILDSQDEANLRLLKRPELGITFTKLHCWRLTEFEKCVFLDADTLVLENCDELFEREELSAAPDIGWPDCFNSGVFVYRPSIDTYENLIQFALEKGSFDGGDQGLLNLYFSDWAHKDISKHLPFIYNMSSTACYSYLPAFKQFGKNAKILHFIGSCKPWLQYFNTETRKVHPSEDLKHLEQILQHWWNIFCNLIHPALSPDMAGLAGAFANLTLGQARTPEQEALDDHLRRQGWEVGNIDYLGRDCFDNIWTKICETISQGPDAEPLSATKDKKLEQPVSQKEPTSKSAETVEHPQTPKHTEPVLTDINQPTTNIEDKGVELAKETEPPVAAKVEPFVECIITQPTKSPEQEKKTITKSNIDSSPEISLGSETSIPTTAVSESTGLEVEKSSKETSVTELNLETPQKLSSTETSTDISKSTPEISPPVQLETGKKVESEVFGKQDSAVIQHEDYNPTIGAPLDTPVKSKTSELVASETPHTDPIQTQSLHLETPIQTDDLKLVLDTQKLKSSIQKDNLTVSETPNFKSSIQTESLIEVSETPKIESPIQTEDSKPISESQKPISAEPEIAKTLTAPENPKSTETPTVKTSESLVGTKGVSQLISQETELSNQLPKQASKEVSVPQEVASIPIEKDTSKDVAAAKVTSKDVQAYMTAPISKKTVTSEETTKKSPVAKEIPKEASKEVSKPITKEPKQKETVPLPTSKVTESTPPTTPSAESSIPETPSTAAAQDTVPGPTPPPRKASGAPKKTGGKKK